ncbi:MAG: CotH kinase family protein [Mogibacterium sp.]|nr:CotH kinase family protein [Mogibacterium sp.]
MKRISTFLLTLVLSISMLVPGMAMDSAVYAEDEQPAAEAIVENAEGAGAAESGAAAAEAEDSAAADPQAGPGADSAPQAPAAGYDGSSVGAPAADSDQASTDESSIEGSEAGLAGSEEQTDAAAAESQATEADTYSTISMPELYDAKALVVPENMKDKVEVTRTKSGDGLLFTGKVADLNAMTFPLNTKLSFDSGSVGRVTVDGLKDKDRGMGVSVELCFDGSESPAAAASLKKQTGKAEWSNSGEQNVSITGGELSGSHSLALRLKITGKDDTSKTTVMLRSIRFCKTTVPVMYLNIDESEGTIEAMNKSEDHSVECYGNVELVVPDEFNKDTTFRDEYGTQKSLTGKDALELEYIRGRGNSTWMDDKKPYKVKFDKAQDLFGFGKNKHWILLANRYDNSFVRNRMTYWLGQQLGMEYTPQCVPIEVVMNGEFLGSYLLCEQIRIGKGRVEIDDLDDIKDAPALTDDLVKTGGYLLSMDWEEDDEKCFALDSGMRFFIESPDDNAKYFNEYIKAYTQKVENAIFSPDFKDAEGHPYTDYLDIDAAVDYWWIQEFSSNGDAFNGGSTYLYKKRESASDPGKLYWGPLWDFDYVAWGDLDYDVDPMDSIDSTASVWFETMKCDPVFIAKVKARWNGDLKGKLQEITKKGGRLDKYLAQMETSYIYDHEKWGPYESKLTEYKDEIEQLRAWINKRIELVDKEVAELSTEAHSVKFMADGKLIKEAKVIGMLRDNDFPEAPEKDGFVFTGWTDEDEAIYKSGARINEDTVLNAVYTEESEVVHAKDIFFQHYEVYYTLYSDAEGTDWYSQECSVKPDDAVDTDIVWTSSNEEIGVVDESGIVEVKTLGDVTITATLPNGISKSYDLHIVKPDSLPVYEEVALSTESLTLKEGEYEQILTEITPKNCEAPDMIWVSSDESVATVDSLGVVTAVAPGQTEVLAVDSLTREVLKCKVNVMPLTTVGMTVEAGGSSYQITSDEENNRTAMLVQPKNAKSVTIPTSVELYGNTYDVTKINEKAFSKTKKVKALYVKTKKLTKASVKGSLKGSKVKKVKVRVGKKKLNKKYAKKYRKYFTKKNCGKKVKVS